MPKKKKGEYKESTLESAFIFYLRTLGEDLGEPQREVMLLKGVTGKASRCDFVWEAHKVVVECEGGTWNGGRHTTGTGFRDDCKKYNALTILGYRVLRFTTDMLADDPASCIEQVRSLLNPS